MKKILIYLILAAVLSCCVTEETTTTTTSTSTTTTSTTTTTSSTTTTTTTTTTSTTAPIDPEDAACSKYCNEVNYTLGGSCQLNAFECQKRGMDYMTIQRKIICPDFRKNACCCRTNHSRDDAERKEIADALP